MFHWDKTINAINIPACNIVQLFRSMRELQLALPGVAAQQASAILCQYQVEGGVGTVAVFHLHKSEVLAFYFSEPRVVPEKKSPGMLDKGLNFVESMGFLMTDQDIHLLDSAEQELLWASLPIKTGLPCEKKLMPVAAMAKRAEAEEETAAEPEMNRSYSDQEENKDVVASAASSQVIDEWVATVAEPEKATSATELKTETADNVDDLLAAVEAMRTKRPGLRERKSAPSAEEMRSRQLQLCETVGRILASL